MDIWWLKVGHIRVCEWQSGDPVCLEGEKIFFVDFEEGNSNPQLVTVKLLLGR